MVHELKKSIGAGKVLFGVKQSLKNSKTLDKALVPEDCRDDVINMLEENGVDVEFIEFSKEDLASKLELDFKCEVFGIKK